MTDDATKKQTEEELKKELKNELGLTVAPPQLTLQKEPIPNPDLDEIADKEKK